MIKLTEHQKLVLSEIVIGLLLAVLISMVVAASFMFLMVADDTGKEVAAALTDSGARNEWEEMGPEHPISHAEPTPSSPPAIIPPPPPPPPPAFEMKLVQVWYLDATAYHRWSDKKPGYRRVYANDDLDALPASERVMQEHHYTVALDLSMDDFHRALIQLDDGQCTHRYRMHVPGYNTDENGPSEHYTGLLSDFNGSYFSVPRDRMPSQWTSRIDVLFTGDREHADQESRIWGKRLLPVEIWEIVPANRVKSILTAPGAGASEGPQNQTTPVGAPNGNAQ